MVIVVVFLVVLAAVMGGVAVVLGWVADTTQPGRLWYPAGPDPEPWRVD